MHDAVAFPTVRLDELVDVLDHLRAPINGEERSRRVGTVPYYGANGQQGWIDRPLTNEPLILLAEDGGNFDAFAERPIAYRIEGPAWVNNHAHIIRAKSGVSQGFIFWSIAHKDIRQFIAGGTRTKLTQGELRRIEVRAPGEPERAQIAQVLDTLDATIRQTEKIIEKLKQVKQGLLHDLLTRGIDANDELRPPQIQAPHLYKGSPLGWIPQDWKLQPIEKLAREVTSGARDWARFYADSGATFVRIGNLTREHINFRLDSLVFVRPPKVGDGQRTKLEAGDILISITADLGIVGVVPDTLGEAYINQHIALIRVDGDLANSRFLGHLLSGHAVQRHIATLNDAGAKAGLNLPTIRGLLVVVPAMREQERIASRLDALDLQIASAKEERSKMAMLKSGLMNDLLTGRVRVTPLLT